MNLQDCFLKFKQIKDTPDSTFVENTKIFLNDIITRKSKLCYILYEREYDDIYIACLRGDAKNVNRLLLKLKYFDYDSSICLSSIRVDRLLFVALIMGYKEVIDIIGYYIKIHHLYQIILLIEYFDPKLIKKICSKINWESDLNNLKKYNLVIIFDGMIPLNMGIPLNSALVLSIRNYIELAMRWRCWGAVSLFMCNFSNKTNACESPIIFKNQYSAKVIQRFWRNRKIKFIKDLLLIKLNGDLSEYIIDKYIMSSRESSLNMKQPIM